MKTRTVFATVIAILILSLFSETTRVPELLAESEQFYAKIKVFTSILETIQRSYVEKKDPDELIDDAIRGVISNLDPHTVYLPSDDFKSWSQSFEGYTGIGIAFEVLRGYITVISIMDSSPADQVGIKPGDRVTKINDESTIGLSREQAINLLNGPPGLPVNLEIIRKNSNTPQKLQLIRERIVLNSIPFATMIRPHTGYVKLDRFTSSSSRELDETLNMLEKQGMRKLVLDLRENGGGYLNAAVEVADKFVPGGHVIVTTKGRLTSSHQQFFSTSEKTRRSYPLIVLIDHGSASASEIVAGAIQDLDRGLVIGKTSFGKGLVQSQYRFHDGSALLITTARYYTPSGRPIQRNFFDKSKDEYYREAYNDTLINNEFSQPHDHVYRTRLGRPVYGGGGIMPDVRIENNENTLSEPLRRLYFSEKRSFYVFIDEYIKKFPHIKTTENDFIRHFVVTNGMYREFMEFVKYYEPSVSTYELMGAANQQNIRFLLKREMGYMLWGKETRFRINLSRDFQLNEALGYFSKAQELLTMAKLN